MKPKSIEQLVEEDKQDENLQMCRRIREERDKKFKTVNELFAHLNKVSRAGKKRGDKTRPKFPSVSKESRTAGTRIS